MTNKGQILKMIEGRIDTMQTLAMESIELIYNAGYNEALDKAADIASNTDKLLAAKILGLKK
jgi:hypothetical protein